MISIRDRNGAGTTFGEAGTQKPSSFRALISILLFSMKMKKVILVEILRCFADSCIFFFEKYTEKIRILTQLNII
jgi:hypothetical protein